MEQDFTPIGQLSFKSILDKSYGEWHEVRLWSKSTKPITLKLVANNEKSFFNAKWPQVFFCLVDSLIKGTENLQEKYLGQIEVDQKSYIFIIDEYNFQEGWITVSKQIYRSEMRSGERLLCYPHRSIYVYTVCPLEHVNNIVFLNPTQPESIKNNSKNIKEKKSYLSLREAKIKDGDIIGLRVFDLASGGASLIVVEDELLMLQENIENMNFTLSYQGEKIKLESVTIVYKANMILPEYKPQKLYKLGLSFVSNKVIANCISEELTSSIRIEDLEKEHL